MSESDVQRRLAHLARVLPGADEAEAWESLREALTLLGPWLLARLSLQFGLRGEDAEDLLSEATLRVFQSRSRLRGSLAGYFASVTRNAALDRLEASRRELPRLDEQQAAPLGEQDRPTRATGDVARVLEGLDSRDRRILEAYAQAADEFSWTESVARELGLTPNAVRVRKLRALERVRRALGEPSSAAGEEDQGERT